MNEPEATVAEPLRRTKVFIAISVVSLLMAAGALAITSKQADAAARADTVYGLIESNQRAEADAIVERRAATREIRDLALDGMETLAAESAESLRTMRYSGELYKTRQPGPRVLIIVDEDWRVRYMNATAEKLTGRDLQAMLGKSPGELLPPDLRGLYEGPAAVLPEPGVDPLIMRVLSAMGGGYVDGEGEVHPGTLDIYATRWAEDGRLSIEITPDAAVGLYEENG